MKLNTLVKFDTHNLDNWDDYPFSKHDRFVYMGDIVQMPGHCIVARLSDGKIFTCYHTYNFVKLSENEI